MCNATEICSCFSGWRTLLHVALWKCNEWPITRISLGEVSTGTTPKGTSDSGGGGVGGGGGGGGAGTCAHRSNVLKNQNVRWLFWKQSHCTSGEITSHYDTKSYTNYVKTNSDHQSARFMIWIYGATFTGDLQYTYHYKSLVGSVAIVPFVAQGCSPFQHWSKYVKKTSSGISNWMSWYH